MKRCWRIFFIVFILGIQGAVLYGHPHLFIENSFTFVFNQEGLKGINVRWIFDEIYSASTIMDFDLDRDNILGDKEIKNVELNAFSNLKNFNYFMHIEINHVDFAVTAVSDFNAEIKDNKVIYYFFVPLNIPARPAEQVVKVGSYDSSFFCNIENSTIEPVKLNDMPSLECSWEMVEDKGNAYWGDTIIPQVTLVRFGKKNG